LLYGVLIVQLRIILTLKNLIIVDEFTEIRRFVSVDLLNQVTEILDDHNVMYKIEDTSYAFDITFTHSQMNIEYILKVRHDEVEKVEALLEGNISADLNVDEYYLDSFSDSELIELISNQEEWSKYDIEYSRKLISKRNIEIDEAEINKSKENRIEELNTGIKAKPIIIFCGYMFSILGGWLGLIVAISLRYTKRVISNNNKVFYYDDKSRAHGDNMLLIFAVWLLITLLLLVYY
jgi:hypothetical protein